MEMIMRHKAHRHTWLHFQQLHSKHFRWLVKIYLWVLPQDLGYVRRRIEAKLINWPFSPLRLASWLRTANIGSLTADPHPNHVVNFNQAKLIRAIARPTSKGRKGRSPKQWFSSGIMVLNSKKRALFFSAGEEEKRRWTWTLIKNTRP